MSQIICVVDSVDSENPFKTIYNSLDEFFDTRLVSLTNNPNNIEVISNIMDVQKMNPVAIVSNSLQAIALTKQIRTTLYVSDIDGGPFKDLNVAIRRQLQVRPELEIISSSSLLARVLYLNYQVKSKVQYPYIPHGNYSSRHLAIVYNENNMIIDNLQQELHGEVFYKYESIDDMSIAKIYVHTPVKTEYASLRMPMASCWGVPVVTIDSGCASEFATSGDTILPYDSNVKQWVQGVKMSIRDHDKNYKASKEQSKKYSNLDALVDKFKQVAEQRAQRKMLLPEAKNVNIPQKPVNSPPSENYVHPPIPQAGMPPISPIPPRPFIPQAAKVTKAIIGTPFTAPVGVPPVKEPYVVPTTSRIELPEWKSSENIDVSIIIPLYRSNLEIIEQIRSWDISDDGLSKEIIYVDDNCPQNSKEAVISSWLLRKPYIPSGKVLYLNNNSGFATACNEGFVNSRGKYVIFLNADTTVTPNWIKPMYDLMEEDNSIGIVGNLQLKTGDLIDSAGSEWMWDNRSFEHIGRNVYKGKRLNKTMHLSETPEDLLCQGEREMVTGCCMMMNGEVFRSIGGFDIGYRVGYWEDSDINMKVKERGLKIYYQPKSVIYHKGSHSRAGLHPFIMDNAKRFYEKWVDNYKIDQLIKPRPVR